MKKQIFFTMAALFGLMAGVNAQSYQMKITKADGSVVLIAADEVKSVTFVSEAASAAEEVAGTYLGWTSASAAYFSNMNSNGDQVVLTANADGSLKVVYASATWGTGTFDNVPVTLGDEYVLAETEGSIGMAMGGGTPKNYAAILKSATISKDKSTYTFVFTAPSVMGGTTMTFRNGTAPEDTSASAKSIMSNYGK